jgi:hypothetical protein
LPDGSVFKPKIQIWVNFGGSCTGIFWHILWTLGPFYELSLYFWTFGIVSGNLVFFPVLVFCTKKNLATLIEALELCIHRLKMLWLRQNKNAQLSRFFCSG